MGATEPMDGSTFPDLGRLLQQLVDITSNVLLAVRGGNSALERLEERVSELIRVTEHLQERVIILERGLSITFELRSDPGAGAVQVSPDTARELIETIKTLQSPKDPGSP